MQAITRLFALLVLVASVSVAPVAAQDDTAPTDGTASVETGAAAGEIERLTAGESPAAQLAATVKMPGSAPDYEAWARAAHRAEQALDASRASNDALQSLRSEMSQWRDRFADARAENSVRISTLRNQIGALGPEPAEGESESPAVARQREILQNQLELVETPVLAAQIAHARADDIISQIDILLRSRQADTLLSAGPSPLNPSNWAATASDINRTFHASIREVRANWLAAANRQQIRNALPAVIVLTIVGLALLLRGRAWSGRLGDRILRRTKWPSRGVWGFLLSVVQMILPIFGVLFLLIAVNLSSVFGVRSEVVVSSALAVLASVVLARWLGIRVFGRGDADWEILSLTSTARTEGRVEATFLGLAYGLHGFAKDVAEADNYSDATIAIIELPILILAGVLLVRIGRLLRAHAVEAEPEGEERAPFRDRLLSLGGRALILGGISGAALAVLGYGALGQFIIYALAGSIALIGVLLILHVLFVDLYGLIAGKSLDESQDALTPVLASLIVLIASTPLFALIWGARTTDMREIWKAVGEGLSVGDTTITPASVIFLIVIFAIGYGITKLIQGMLTSTVLPKTRIDVGGQNAITSGIGYVGYFLAAVVAITAAGIDLSSLAIVAGALSVGIGFGLQTIVSNFVSGIILLIERPISEGDWISVGGNMGIVKDISVRSTRIETFDKQDVMIPNSDFISGTVTNYTRGNSIGRLVINVGVAYGTDTRWVHEILTEIVQDHPLVTVNPAPQVGFMAFGADSLEFQVRAVLSDVGMILIVQDELNHQIAERFAKEGIEVPFAQRDIWLRNPEVLRGEGNKPAKDGGSGPAGGGDSATSKPVRDLPKDYDEGAGEAADGDGD